MKLSARCRERTFGLVGKRVLTGPGAVFRSLLLSATVLGLSAAVITSAAAAAGPARTAQLALGSQATPDEALGTSVALSSNGKVAILGVMQRTSAYGGLVPAQIFTLKNGKWSRPIALPLNKSIKGPLYPPAVALSGDGKTALVGFGGIRTSDPGSNDVGAGFLFSFSKGAWRQTAELTLGSAAQNGDQLGASAALSADGKTVLLGAPGRERKGARGYGAGAVFTLGKRGWLGPTLLTLGSLGSDLLGQSVALSANGNTALLGAPRNRAAAEVFTRSGGKWSHQAELGQNLIGGGLSVALNGLGTTAIVGGINPRMALVYAFSSGRWQKGTYLRHVPLSGSSDQVPTSVALNAAGTEALIGTPGWYLDNGNSSSAGIADEFTLSGGTWTQGSHMSLPMPQSGDEFGFSTALSSKGSVALIGTPGRAVGKIKAAGAGEVWSIK